MIIYKITNKINDKIYIGQTTLSAIERFNKHWNEANCKNRPNNYFHNALLLYGKDNFSIEVIDTASSRDELNIKEDYWIKKLNARDKNIGYNLQAGGKSGEKNEETKKKISEKKKENWRNPEFASRCKEGLVKATKAWQEHCLENKVEIECQFCHKKFKVAPYEAKTRKYCSNDCANSENIKKATAVAAKKKKENTQKRNELFKNDVHNWVLVNKELVKNCPINKISTTLQGIQKIALDKYNFSDWRMISKAIYDTTSKKELLKYLQDYVKMYAELV